MADRMALHQRSLSELNIAASNNRVSHSVSDYSNTPTTVSNWTANHQDPGYASSRTSLSHSLSLKGLRLSTAEPLERTTFQTLLGRGVVEKDDQVRVPSRHNSSVKRRSRSSVSSSIYTDYTSRPHSPAKRSDSVIKQADHGSNRLPSYGAAPPYSPIPVTPSIRIVPKTPPASLSKKKKDPSCAPDFALPSSSSTSAAARFSASYSSLVVRSDCEHEEDLSFITDSLPSLSARTFDKPVTDTKSTRSLPTVPNTRTRPSSPVAVGSIIEKFEKVARSSSSSSSAPPVPNTPHRATTIRLVPKTPPATTPASVRTRSTSQPPVPALNKAISRPVTSSTVSSRPRSRSSGSRPTSPLSQTQRNRLSAASFQSSIEAIGFPPARPLPTPPLPATPDLIPLPLFYGRLSGTLPPRPSSPETPLRKQSTQLASKASPTTNAPPHVRSILKKRKDSITRPTTSASGHSSESDVTPPFNTYEFPEIQPALEWILEADTPKPTPTKVTRMQVDTGSRPVYPHESYEPDVPTAMAGPSRWFQSVSSGNTRATTSGSDQSPVSPIGAPTRLGNARMNTEQLRKEQSVYSESGAIAGGSHRTRPSGRSSSFSFGMPSRHDRNRSTSAPNEMFSGSRPSSRRGPAERRSSSLSVLPSAIIPEWARIYYGRGRGLDMIVEPGDEITPVMAAPLTHTRSHVSQTPSQWAGTRIQEGVPLKDQFNQPRLDNIPVSRTERLNVQLICFLVGFVFPFAWMVAAVLPLPRQKRLNRRQRRQALELQATSFPISGTEHVAPPLGNNTIIDADVESLPSFDTFQEGRRWDNARWWRNVNRGMSIFGLLLIGGIVALVVVGIMK